MSTPPARLPQLFLRSASLGVALAIAGAVASAPRTRAACTESSTNHWDCSATDTAGLDLSGTTDQVVNVLSDGRVDVTGYNATAIQLGDDSTVNVESDARVSSDGFSSTAVSGGHQIRLNNDGSILATSSGSRAVSLDSGGATSGISDIVNSGVISGSAADAVGIGINGRVDVANSGTIDAGGSGATAISIGGSESEITNTGLIQSRSGAVAIRFEDGGSGNTVVNEKGGRITASDGVAIVGSTSAERVENRGRIAGDVQLGGGDDTLILGTSSSVSGTLDGGSGSDDLGVEGSGEGTLDLDRVQNFETFDYSGSGNLQLQGAGAFSGGIDFSKGTISVLDAVSLTGDLTQHGGNTLAVGLEGGRLDVTGSFDASGSVALVPEGITPDGSRTLVDASGGLNGQFDLPPSSALLRTRFTQTANTLVVDITRRSYASVAETGNQRAVATILDEVAAAGPTGELDQLLGVLDTQDVGGVLGAYDALSPEYYDAHTDAAFDMGRQFDAVLTRPPIVCRAAQGPQSGVLWRPCEESDLAPWFVGWGTYLDRDSSSDHIGYEQTGGGLALGIEKRVLPWLDVGAALGAARRRIDVHDNGHGSLTTADVGASAAAIWGPAVVRAGVSFGYGWHDARRDVDWPTYSRVADSDFEHRRVGASLEAAPHFDFGPARIEPYAGLDYQYLDQDSVKESGAGALDLEVDGRSDSLLSFATGVRLLGYFYNEKPINTTYDFSRTAFVPELSIGYGRILSGADRTVKASLRSAPAGVGGFEVDAEDAKQALLAGVGLSFQPHRGATVGVHYGLRYGDDTIAHTGSLAVRIPLQRPGGEGG